MGEDFGIKELYHSTQEPEVDIVAVHGLSGDSIKSWTSGNTCWLKHLDFLPKYIDPCRVLTRGSNAVSLALPGNVLSGLINALKEESETLQDISYKFAPLLSRFRLFFFWEQERINLKYTKDHIVEEPSPASILDNTERCGIAADHRGMIKFNNNTLQGSPTVIAAPKRC
ncbi:hypothetical protein VE03_06026 [Pseudogymnoascus sp. 23342-1-I1]|nr:hypothetical protein VE03_06026 [Pseudogymnoascus sp. 23342-1-I1]